MDNIAHQTTKEKSNKDCDKMMTLRGIGHAVNSTIGAASETQQYMKEKRELKAAQSDTNEQPEGKSESQNDTSKLARSENLVDSEADDWELDDSEEEGEESDHSMEKPLSQSDKQEPESIIAPECRDTPLPVPVILPQRRPQARSRGFVPFSSSAYMVP